jgi:hypothetical protein
MSSNVKGPATIHKGSKGASSDLSTMIEEHPCSSVYFVLEECLGVNDRDWRACQTEVAALKLCNNAQQKKSVGRTTG